MDDKKHQQQNDQNQDQNQLPPQQDIGEKGGRAEQNTNTDIDETDDDLDVTDLDDFDEDMSGYPGGDLTTDMNANNEDEDDDY